MTTITATRQPTDRLFLAGLFFLTSSTLLLEILNTRLLSVVTWYHLSFFAVSMAMFGMAAGALWVYLRPASFSRARAFHNLFLYSLLFAIGTILCHAVIVLTTLDIREGWDATRVLLLTMITVAIAIPFFFSGVVVTVALTQVPGNSGFIYAVDLVGAAIGSIGCLALLNALDISSATFMVAAVALLGTTCFARLSHNRLSLAWLGVAGLVTVAALINHQSIHGLRVFHPKGNTLTYDETMREYWTIHGQILLHPIWEEGGPFYWGAGEGAPSIPGMQLYPLVIDGEAGTAVTGWDGNRDELEWPQYDVTALPYHLRPHGDVAVIGVGGGRDILTALWADSTTITGIEINGAILDLLENEMRDFVNLANQPEVQFVHDEARSYLTRVDRHYDLIQMSLIDTWAATGAGAFTLSENGLYTVEGWQIFLNRLNPDGLFSVSRWYSPEALSETNRLLSLAAASLLERGVTDPASHIALVARNSVATLLVSPEPLSATDLDTLEAVADRYRFTIIQSPRHPSDNALIRQVLNAPSVAALEQATSHEWLDFTPPTDSRPYFFNILKPGALFSDAVDLEELGIVAGGNLLATYTLLILCGLSVLGVVLVILIPLFKAGVPVLPAGVFPSGLLYFGLIGTGFMMVQIPLIQRYSVYLGHPVYAVSVLLFSMILSAGLGSFVSDRFAVNRSSRWTLWLPALIAGLLFLIYLISGPVIDNTIDQSLLVRCLIVVVIVAIVAFPMGMCFPLGLRLFREYAESCLPWMWGINGATG
ncbi:MAG: hypothetical protein KDI29_16615, partial [Pseudomonadales bacterium]|nr:hypothetical protein [Pseudomonadales bacterium]